MTNPHGKIKLRGSAITNVGRVRNHNEDNIHLWTGEDLLLAIVADGMGGAAAGEEASRIAVETIMAYLKMNEPSTQALEIDEDQMSSAVKEANVSIMNQAVEHPRQRGMGTTLTMAFVNNQQATFAHVGDSRAYRVNQHGEIEQITSDHSFVQALLDAGHITADQAETHPMGNVLYRALGQTSDLEVDTYYADLAIGDRLVLCSDGLTRHVRPPEIASTVSQHTNPNLMSQQLINLANERGGEDNISVIVIMVEEQGVTFEDEEETVAMPPATDTDAQSDTKPMPKTNPPLSSAGNDGQWEARAGRAEFNRTSRDPRESSEDPPSAAHIRNPSETGPYNHDWPEGRDRLDAR